MSFLSWVKMLAVSSASDHRMIVSRSSGNSFMFSLPFELEGEGGLIPVVLHQQVCIKVFTCPLRIDTADKRPAVFQKGRNDLLVQVDLLPSKKAVIPPEPKPAVISLAEVPFLAFRNI